MASARVASGATAAFLCAALMVVSVARAIRIDAPDSAPPGDATASGPAAGAFGGVASQALPGEAAMAATLDRNPFHPERRRGGVFALAEEQPGQPAAEALAPRAPSRLFGTALVGGPERDFVLCQPEHETARLVWVGERCGTLLLLGVERARARFRDDGGVDVVLEVPKAGTQ